MTPVRQTLADLARLIDGNVIGDDSVEIHRVASIEEAGPGDITFLTHPRYRAYLARCTASAIIVSRDTPIDSLSRPGRNFLQATQPYLAFAKILQLFTPAPRYGAAVNALAAIEPSAALGDGVTIFPHVYVGRDAKVGRGTVLFPGVFLGDRVEVGEDCVFHPHVTVYEGCRVGNRVILHAGAVVGSDGFGYAAEAGKRVKIPQAGTVVIEDDVEIGANSTVDRATLGRTVIGRGTKIDNLVQIAHNVAVGRNSIIAAQTGVAGSTRIGNEVTLAGQVGVVNHVEVGDRAVIGPQSGISRSVPAGAVLSSGIGAVPHRQWLKVVMLLPRLPKLWLAVRRLERQVGQVWVKSAKGRKAHARRERDL